MAQAQVQLQKPSEGGTSRRSQTRLQESTTDKRALCNTEGRKATLLLHNIPPSAPRPGHWRRKYSQTVTFWRKRFCPRNQQNPFVIWKQQVESCARSFALPGSIVQSPKEQKSQKGIAEESEAAGTLSKGTIYSKTKFLELSIESLKLPRTVHLP